MTYRVGVDLEAGAGLIDADSYVVKCSRCEENKSVKHTRVLTILLLTILLRTETSIHVTKSPR